MKWVIIVFLVWTVNLSADQTIFNVTSDLKNKCCNQQGDGCPSEFNQRLALAIACKGFPSQNYFAEIGVTQGGDLAPLSPLGGNYGTVYNQLVGIYNKYKSKDNTRSSADPTLEQIKAQISQVTAPDATKAVGPNTLPTVVVQSAQESEFVPYPGSYPPAKDTNNAETEYGPPRFEFLKNYRDFFKNFDSACGEIGTEKHSKCLRNLFAHQFEKAVRTYIAGSEQLIYDLKNNTGFINSISNDLGLKPLVDNKASSPSDNSKTKPSAADERESENIAGKIDGMYQGYLPSLFDHPLSCGNASGAIKDFFGALNMSASLPSWGSCSAAAVNTANSGGLWFKNPYKDKMRDKPSFEEGILTPKNPSGETVEMAFNLNCPGTDMASAMPTTSTDPQHAGAAASKAKGHLINQLMVAMTSIRKFIIDQKKIPDESYFAIKTGSGVDKPVFLNCALVAAELEDARAWINQVGKNLKRSDYKAKSEGLGQLGIGSSFESEDETGINSKKKFAGKYLENRQNKKDDLAKKDSGKIAGAALSTSLEGDAEANLYLLAFQQQIEMDLALKYTFCVWKSVAEAMTESMRAIDINTLLSQAGGP